MSCAVKKSKSRFGEAIDGFDIQIPRSYCTDQDRERRLDLVGKSCHFDPETKVLLGNQKGILVPGEIYWVRIMPILSRVTPEQCWYFLEENGATAINSSDCLLLLAQRWKVITRYTPSVFFHLGDHEDAVNNGYGMTSVYLGPSTDLPRFESGLFNCGLAHPDHLVYFSLAK